MSILKYSAPILLVALVACTEPRGTERAAPPPTPAIEARLELSDSTARAGSEIRVLVRLAGKSAGGVASFTGKLAFDTTSLRFVAEDTVSDGATRAMSSASGLLRLAAVAPNGFTNGQLYTLRFSVRRTPSPQTLRLTVDELHTTSGTDAAKSLAPEEP